MFPLQLDLTRNTLTGLPGDVPAKLTSLTSQGPRDQGPRDPGTHTLVSHTYLSKEMPYDILCPLSNFLPVQWTLEVARALALLPACVSEL